MKKHYSIYLVLTFIYIIMTSCGKRCEDFNNDILNWMPYKKGETIVFQKDGVLDTCNLVNNEIYHTDKIGAWTKCDCEDSYSLTISSDSLNIEIIFHQSIDVSDSYIYINNEGLSFVKQESSYTYHNISYSNVLIYENSRGTEDTRFHKVIISKSIGIIGIIGKSEEWIIFDDSTRSIQIADVNQNFSDC